MTDIRMIGEMRTDTGQEAVDLKAEHWGEAVFTIGDEEIVIEISVEEKTIISLMAGEEAQWKGTLEGFKKFLRGEIPAR
jgi:hypothetical protein